ncbi:MAG: M50 family metallopeptidase [Phycisphaeraceae bacterium]|nr:M50 family metallopeptidase [Phycisphaeraceae bacterium]
MINGSFKLFRLFGIDVFLHWSWFVIAIFLIPQFGKGTFTGPGNTPIYWSALLYVTLFVIVLIHEFGHALACRSVGGQARHIVLWPLGGVAFVQPPHRPGAHLWSIVAGPLVNVMLIPVTIIAYFLVSGSLMLPDLASSNLEKFAFYVMALNFMLLIFNMLPVYPLDGGQTLLALLWFVIGRVKALKVVSIIGLTAAGFVLLFSIVTTDMWYIILSLFVGMQAWNGYRLAKTLAKMDPRLYDERIAKQAEQDNVEQRIVEEIDPWRQ